MPHLGHTHDLELFLAAAGAQYCYIYKPFKSEHIAANVVSASLLLMVSAMQRL